MINHYLIDANNFIGAQPELRKIHKADPERSRELFVFQIEKLFFNRKNPVTIFFDGFAKSPIASKRMKFIFSDKREADTLIREFIDHAKNRKSLTLITNDIALASFAKKCSVSVMNCDTFVSSLTGANQATDEDEKIDQLNYEKNEFIKLFGGNSPS